MDQLIQILANNARLSAEQLAAMTGSTPAQVAARIDALQAEGDIRG